MLCCDICYQCLTLQQEYSPHLVYVPWTETNTKGYATDYVGAWTGNIHGLNTQWQFPYLCFLSLTFLPSKKCEVLVWLCTSCCFVPLLTQMHLRFLYSLFVQTSLDLSRDTLVCLQESGTFELDYDDSERQSQSNEVPKHNVLPN